MADIREDLAVHDPLQAAAGWAVMLTGIPPNMSIGSMMRTLWADYMKYAVRMAEDTYHICLDIKKIFYSPGRSEALITFKSRVAAEVWLIAAQHATNDFCPTFRWAGKIFESPVVVPALDGAVQQAFFAEHRDLMFVKMEIYDERNPAPPGIRQVLSSYPGGMPLLCGAKVDGGKMFCGECYALMDLEVVKHGKRGINILCLNCKMEYEHAASQDEE